MTENPIAYLFDFIHIDFGFWTEFFFFVLNIIIEFDDRSFGVRFE